LLDRKVKKTPVSLKNKTLNDLVHKTVQRFFIDYVRVKMNTCKATLSVFSSVLAEAIPHKERLATLHAICLQISRHISQKCS
jgi:hypothetical protein